MNLTSDHEVEATREKIRLLEARYEALRREPTDDAHVRELTLRSLKRTIHQMQEDILRCSCHAASPRAV
ncbi:MAG: hypothetical protein H8E44_22905 [Planctomycetes bacterium]|nr:hypothetical protein [Planctomycetota bacterium]MBL7039463.1 hypothetical protein [Pirellulaceae bacterium]